MNNSNNSSSISIAGLLGVSFVVLKLLGVINWSWWWVTAPFWAGFVIFFGFSAIALLIAGIAAIIMACKYND